MAREQKPSTRTPHKTTPNTDIYRFIDFFVKASERIRGKKAVIIRGKDGNLTRYALRKIPESKLETLAVWFLANKPKLQPLVGIMLSLAVLDELTREMNRPNFWKDINDLMDRYYPRRQTISTWQPISYEDTNKMKEDVAALMRSMK